MPSAFRLCPGISSAAEAASVVASSPSMISPPADHRVVDHRSQMEGDHDEHESEQRSARADQRDSEVVPGSRVICRTHLRNMPDRWTL
jgi:hypothetical protein